MTACKYQAGRLVPISYSQDADLQHIEADRFFIGQLLSGCTVLLINGDKFYVSKKHVLLFPRNTTIKVLAAQNLHIQSLSFTPEFINVHLNWPLIESSAYAIKALENDYPSFDLFYKHSSLYQGILPIEGPFYTKVTSLFESIIRQLTVQPDVKWSCRSRSNLFEMFDLLTNAHDAFFCDSGKADTLAQMVINYLHLHLADPIQISLLCEHFHTNRTTLCSKFKALTGKSIVEYLIDKRLELARHALAFTNLSINEIAHKYGFHELSYFMRVFKKRIGVTPLTYRKDMRAKRQ